MEREGAVVERLGVAVDLPEEDGRETLPCLFWEPDEGLAWLPPEGRELVVGRAVEEERDGAEEDLLTLPEDRDGALEPRLIEDPDEREEPPPL